MPSCMTLEKQIPGRKTLDHLVSRGGNIRCAIPTLPTKKYRLEKTDQIGEANTAADLGRQVLDER